MEISYLKHAEVNRKKWDQSIAESSNGLLYAHAWYLDLVSPGWDALVSTDYSFVMPLTWKKKYGVKYIFQPFFVQQLGVFSSQEIAGDVVPEFISAIPDEFQFLDFYLNHANHIPAGSLDNATLHPRLTHHLSLHRDYENIRTGYSGNLTRNLKKALKNDISIEENIPAEELINLFRRTRGAAVEKLGSKEYSLLKSIASEAGKRNLLQSFGIRKLNKLIAGAFFLRSNHEYIFIFSATSEEAKQQGAMSFIIDSFIRKHEKEKMKLDFEGSMDKNLSRFYKSFGATEIVYLHIQQNKLPKLVRWMKKTGSKLKA